jgi:hypothetical protein
MANLAFRHVGALIHQRFQAISGWIPTLCPFWPPSVELPWQEILDAAKPIHTEYKEEALESMRHCFFNIELTRISSSAYSGIPSRTRVVQALQGITCSFAASLSFTEHDRLGRGNVTKRGRQW